MTKKNLEKLINDFHNIKKEISFLEEKKEGLRNELNAQFELLKTNRIDTADGHYAQKVIRTLYEIKPNLLQKRLDPKQFIKCVKVGMKVAELFLPRAELQKISNKREQTIIKTA